MSGDSVLTSSVGTKLLRPYASSRFANAAANSSTDAFRRPSNRLLSATVSAMRCKENCESADAATP